jgi:cyclic beta-1,2-glucan synthetase
MLNPVNRSSSRAAIHRYKVEPYVVSADVYSRPPHVGRGGWTWYTGSAGWMYSAGLEWILGFHLQGASLLLDPCIPKIWESFEIRYRYRSAAYEIKVENPANVSRGILSWSLDGIAQPPSMTGTAACLRLTDDGAIHHVVVVLGAAKNEPVRSTEKAPVRYGVSP